MNARAELKGHSCNCRSKRGWGGGGGGGGGPRVQAHIILQYIYIYIYNMAVPPKYFPKTINIITSNKDLNMFW